MAESQTGRTLGQYRLSERIGIGGMGVVYRAVHQRLGRQAAVKVLPEALASDANFLRRFEREAANAAALQHNNILAVWDYGEENGVPYLVMPYITGGTLRHRLANGPLRPQEALAYIRQVAEALDFAHSQGIIHRDVKPANLLLDERGQLYLADFGIAKALEGAEGLTRTGMGVGTPEYMAPEQAQGRADSRSDLYALGIILYQMLTGQVPFSGNSTVEVLMKHLQDQPPLIPLRSIQPTLPQGVERVVQKALSKNPNDRYQSGKALVEAFAEALTPERAGGGMAYTPPTPPPAEMQPTTYGPTMPYGAPPQMPTPAPPMPTPTPPPLTPHPMQAPTTTPMYAQPQYQAPLPGQVQTPPPPGTWGSANAGGAATSNAGGGSANRVLIGGLAAAIVVLLICLTSIGAYALFRDTTTPTPVPTVNAAATGTASAVAAFNLQATQTANAPTPIPSPSPTTTPTRPPTPTTAPLPSPSAPPTATPTRPSTPTPTQPPVVAKNPRGTPIAGWKTFSGHARVPFALYYPPDWTIDTQSVDDGIIYVRPPSAGSTWMLIATTGIPETNGNIDVLRDQYYNNTLGECTKKAIDRTNYTEYSSITFAGLGATCETTTGLTYARIGLGLNNQVPWRYRLNAPYGEYSDALDDFFQPMLNSLNIYQNP